MINKVFLAGFVVSDVKYEFIIHGKDNSIAKFYMKVNKEKILQITAFNDIADYCYRKLKPNDDVIIYGWLSQDHGVVIDEIQKIAK